MYQDSFDSGVPMQLNSLADSFGSVALAQFAADPNSAHLFRAQHEHIIRMLDELTTLCSEQVQNPLDTALKARNMLTQIRVLASMHQTLENNVTHQVVATDPVLRISAEQFEREMVPLLAELSALSKRYPAPSTIAADLHGFTRASGELFTRLRERYRREEREAFPAFDRAASDPVMDQPMSVPSSMAAAYE